MRIYIAFIMTILSLAFISCEPPWPTDQAGPRKLKPYNPKKAGAAIVASFNLTGYSDLDNISYDIAECNGNIYIRFRTKMLVFDKETLQKKNEFNLNFQNYSPFEHSYIGEFAVINDNTAFLINGSYRSDTTLKYPLFTIDLSTGNLEIVNNENIIGFDWEYDFRVTAFIGYDSANTDIWMLIKDEERKNYFFNYFQYDNLTQTLSFSGKKEGFTLNPDPGSYSEAWTYGYSSYINGLSIYGDESWNNIFFKNKHTNGIVAVRLEKRNLDNPTKVVQFIDVEYLGTLTIPQSIIYDPPYIWIMVERKNKVQMLKLLPKERQ